MSDRKWCSRQCPLKNHRQQPELLCIWHDAAVCASAAALGIIRAACPRLAACQRRKLRNWCNQMLWDFRYFRLIYQISMNYLHQQHKRIVRPVIVRRLGGRSNRLDVDIKANRLLLWMLGHQEHLVGGTGGGQTHAKVNGTWLEYHKSKMKDYRTIEYVCIPKTLTNDSTLLSLTNTRITKKPG